MKAKVVEWWPWRMGENESCWRQHWVRTCHARCAATMAALPRSNPATLVPALRAKTASVSSAGLHLEAVACLSLRLVHGACGLGSMRGASTSSPAHATWPPAPPSSASQRQRSSLHHHSRTVRIRLMFPLVHHHVQATRQPLHDSGSDEPLLLSSSSSSCVLPACHRLAWLLAQLLLIASTKRHSHIQKHPKRDMQRCCREPLSSARSECSVTLTRADHPRGHKTTYNQPPVQRFGPSHTQSSPIIAPLPSSELSPPVPRRARTWQPARQGGPDGSEPAAGWDHHHEPLSPHNNMMHPRPAG